MGGGELFHEETSRKFEALYLTPDVVEQRWQVLKALELREAEKVLDVGSGPGLLAYDMAASQLRPQRSSVRKARYQSPMTRRVVHNHIRRLLATRKAAKPSDV
jgi:hypothetical protein